MRQIVCGLASAGLMAATLQPIAAEQWPSRPVTVIVSQSAGGISDVVTRAFTAKLHEKFGQPFVVENRPGAEGMNAAHACAQSKPDGYTICIMSASPSVWNRIMHKSVPFDPDKDFAPITNLFTITGVLGVNASLGIKSLKQLVEHSKANPGKMSYATISALATLFMEQFKRDTGAALVAVPFRGGGEAVVAVLHNHTQVGIFGLGNFVPHLKSGKVIALAKDGVGRLKDFPDIPTFPEAGYDGDRARSWFGVFAPAGMSPDIIQTLNKAFKDIGSPPDFQQTIFYNRGIEPAFTSPEDFAKEIIEDRVVAERIAKAGGVKPQ